MKSFKKRKGITLISLIVTVIILLILAGISIELIGGSNGILTRTAEALDKNDRATAAEKLELKITYLNMVSYGEKTRKATLQEVADGLFADKEVEYVKLKNQEVASLEAINVEGESSFLVKLKEYSYEFEIDENLQLASVDGTKVENPEKEAFEAAMNEMKATIETLNAEMNGLKQTNQDLLAQMTELQNQIKAGNKAYTLTTLASSTLLAENTVDLTDNVANYQYVMVQYTGGAGTNYVSGWVPISYFKSAGNIGACNARINSQVEYISDTQCKMEIAGEEASCVTLFRY